MRHRAPSYTAVVNNTLLLKILGGLVLALVIVLVFGFLVAIIRAVLFVAVLVVGAFYLGRVTKRP